MKLKPTNISLRTLAIGAALLTTFVAAHAQDFTARVVARGLQRPTGIVVGSDDELYFTEVPSPGIAGAGNAVKMLDLEDGNISTLHTGEPEPTNLALGKRGSLYWTCKSAGVILEQGRDGVTTPVLRNLAKPSGVAVDKKGNIYYTQLPTPGVPGSQGGSNSVVVFNGTASNVLHQGEPEPTDIVVDKKGEFYWTCKSAGVILAQTGTGSTTVVLNGLNKPTGIALKRKGDRLYFTEVPTPGVSGRNGGQNKVWELNLRTNVRTLVNAGDPEPTDVSVNDEGDVYWTCSSAGVIVEAKRVKKSDDRE